MSGHRSLIRPLSLIGLSLLTGPAWAATDPLTAPVPPVLDTSVPAAPALSLAAPFAEPVRFIAEQTVIRPDMQGQLVEQVDVLDEINFSFQPTGTVGPLRPGRHVINWQATDLGSNTSSTQLTIDVIPQLNFAMDQTVGEGGTAIVRALLSGLAPSYPVTVNFTISNNNNGGGVDDGINDHSLAGSNGSLVFNEGQTEAQLAIDIYADPDSGEGESIELAFDIPSLPGNQVSAGYQTRHRIQISEQAIPPIARLRASQRGINTRDILLSGGDVVISAETYDANGDTIHFDWSATDNALSPTAGTVGSTFTFDPAGLTPGYYTVRLTVSDERGSANAQHLLLRLREELPILDATLDSDDDQQDDLSEGFADSDNDGIADYLDALDLANQVQSTANFLFDASLQNSDQLVSDSITLDWSLDSTASRLVLYPLLISAPAGLKVEVGITAFADGQSHAKLPTRRAEVQRGSFLANDLVSSDGQMLDIKISQLANAGDLVDIIVPQAVPVLASTPGNQPQFYNFNNINQWQVFVEADGEQIRSSLKQDDSYCPSMLKRNLYTGTLAAGDECLLIRIRDGGPNDYDGLRNGAISLMGGVLVRTNSPVVYEDPVDSFVEETAPSFETLSRNDLGTKDTGFFGGASLSWLGLLFASLGLWWRRSQ